VNDPVAPSRSPLLGREGAVAGHGPDADVAWHYGDPTREQRALVAGEAVVDTSHREVVTVSGPDRLTWLDTLSTQWLRDLARGVSAEALILSPHGHVENALHLVDDGETAWITVEPSAGAPLVAHLEKMRFMLRVEITDVTADWAVLSGVRGVVMKGLAEGRVAWQDPWPAVTTGGVGYSVVDTGDHPGAERSWVEVLVPRSEIASLTADLTLAGTWAAEALRVAAWRPRFGVDTDHRTIPHELDWLRTAVHMAKGCYRGQETVARVHNLGRPPRRAVFLHLDGSGHQLPEPGTLLTAPTSKDGERPIGRLTSVARHHELGPIALAVVKRSVPLDAVLVADGVSAAQEAVVAP
jgi:folate-binding protein YgfZ